MAQSLTKVYIHLIFRIKNGHPKIRKADKKQIYAYMASIIKDNQSIPIAINGVEDHVHILCVLSKNVALAKLVEEIKRHSSRMMKALGTHYAKFGWQGGYGAFSVSATLHDKIKQYIEKQEEHHAKMNYAEEYLKYLKEYSINYNEKFVWTD